MAHKYQFLSFEKEDAIFSLFAPSFEKRGQNRLYHILVHQK
jgi:hypothetical protein